MRFAVRLLPAVVALVFVTSRAQAVEWKSWNAGLSAAASARRPVLVDVYTDWCRWCKQMDRDVYARSDVGQYLSSHFITVRLNAEGGELVSYQGRNMSARSLASAFDVSGYPTTIFLTSSGDHLVNVPGYVGPDRFLLLLRYIGDGHMDRGVKWEDYLKQTGAKPAP
jgi:thioredoxin-related protein